MLVVSVGGQKQALVDGGGLVITVVFCMEL